MKKFNRGVLLLTLFALTGVGATFAADGQSDNIQNFFLGNAPVTSSDLNPVLVLYYLKKICWQLKKQLKPRAASPYISIW